MGSAVGLHQGGDSGNWDGADATGITEPAAMKNYPLVNVNKQNYGKSPFFMGKTTINGLFNSYVRLCLFTRGYFKVIEKVRFQLTQQLK